MEKMCKCGNMQMCKLLFPKKYPLLSVKSLPAGARALFRQAGASSAFYSLLDCPQKEKRIPKNA
jgi:hypothetical protein